MKIHKNVSLKDLNTFHLPAQATQYTKVNTDQELIEALEYGSSKEIFILGSGSNMLLTKDLDKLVIHLQTKGINIIQDTLDYCLVEVQAGEIWHEFVLWAISKNLGGIENLSLIPGNVGSSPIQNIGAYGVEVKDVITWVNAINRETFELEKFTNQQCNFSYRESIFKTTHKNKYVITSVVFKLTKHNHNLKTNYGVIQQELELARIQTPSIKNISDIVIKIRQSKLPDPSKLPNSGSFFKNPIISYALFEKIQQTYPDIPSYPIDNHWVKIPAGWLIEKIGFKGFRMGDAGVHSKQALVLVNYGNASGQEILELAQLIQNKILEVFQITITPEVNIF
ncbi:UDP-N-acetylmuramate dehydrogenase [Myroides sp. LJL119]